MRRSRQGHTPCRLLRMLARCSTYTLLTEPVPVPRSCQSMTSPPDALLPMAPLPDKPIRPHPISRFNGPRRLPDRLGGHEASPIRARRKFHLHPTVFRVRPVEIKIEQVPQIVRDPLPVGTAIQPKRAAWSALRTSQAQGDSGQHDTARGQETFCILRLQASRPGDHRQSRKWQPHLPRCCGRFKPEQQAGDVYSALSKPCWSTR